MRRLTINTDLLKRLVETMSKDIVPLTAEGVKKGNKVFGSAILRKDDLSLVIAGTNNEMDNPLWHGEVHTLKLFYEIPASERPDTKDCIFLATHEPCSLCLSAITWAGFDNFYYFFKYEDTSNSFNIPHDLKILEEVFAIKNGEYRGKNEFWECHSLLDHISEVEGADGEDLRAEAKLLFEAYAGLSDTYQASKDNSDIPLS